MEIFDDVDRFFQGVTTHPRRGGVEAAVTPSRLVGSSVRGAGEGGCSTEEGWIEDGKLGLFRAINLAMVVSVWR